MALPLLNNAESQTDGTTVTTGNSGGANADAFDAVVIGASMAMLFRNVNPAHGTNSFRVELLSTATAITHVDWIGSMESNTELSGAFYFESNRVPPTSSIRLVSFRNAGAQVSGIKITSGGGVVSIMDSAGTDIGTPSAGLSANTLYRLEFHFVFNSTSGETARVDVYLGDSTTITTSATATALSMGAAADDFWIGATTANFSSTLGDFIDIDSLKLAVGSLLPIGPGPYTAGPTFGPAIKPDYSRYPKQRLRRS